MTRPRPTFGRRVVIILVIAVALAGMGYFIHEYFQVHHVVAAGNARFTSAYVEAIAGVEEGTHMLSLNTEQIRENIQRAEPYLQVTAVRRQMPDTVIIEVVERHPAAYLPYGASWLLIDINTDILEITDSTDVPECPVVEGISVENPEIGTLLVTQDAFKISIMQEILQDLDQRSLFSMIAVVDLTNINNITMESRDGLEIRLGQAERIGDKIKWIQNRLPALVREGESDGLLDVSSGSFATYTMYDGPQAYPSASPDADTSSTPSPGALWTTYTDGHVNASAAPAEPSPGDEPSEE